MPSAGRQVRKQIGRQIAIAAGSLFIFLPHPIRVEGTYRQARLDMLYLRLLPCTRGQGSELQVRNGYRRGEPEVPFV